MSSASDRKFVNEFVNRLMETEKVALDINESLNTLQHDLTAIEDGWVFKTVIDYHELHRYLHPCVDQDRDSPEKFYLAQLVLSYLFNVSEENLLLLPVYVDEFKARLQTISSDLEALESNVLKTRRQREVIDFVDKLAKGQVTTDTGKTVIRTYALDILIKDNVEKGMSLGMKRFVELVRKGKIYFVEQIKDFDANFSADQFSKEFEAIRQEMTRLRPDLWKHTPNITDAQAALWTKKANECNRDKKNAFVIVSSSFRIKPAFQSIALTLTNKGIPYNSTILRDLHYILFKYYFTTQKLSFQETLAQVDQTRKLFKEYVKAMESLHQKTIEITLKDIDQSSILPLYQQVLDCLWEFESFMVEKTNFEPIEPLPDDDTMEQIKKLSQDNQALSECVKYALDALKSSTQTIDAIYKEILEASNVLRG